MESVTAAPVFPATPFIADDEAMTYRARWTRLDDASCEAWCDAQGKHRWTTMFKMTLRRRD